ncbi:MAG: ABC transporter permease [Gemmataceae bacterium]|nr:ABC transporter permease [Gemmataceae bacterium]
MFRHLSAVWTARHFLLALVKLDLRVRYRRSVLGVGWSLLHPLAMTGVFTVVFSQLFGDGNPVGYAAFALSGLAVWGFLRDSTTVGSRAFMMNESYIRQSPLPYTVYTLRTVLSQATHALLALAVVVGLVMVWKRDAGALGGLAYAPPGLVLALVAAWAVATIGAFITAFFHDTAHLLEVAAQIGFFLTPIMYRRTLFDDRGLGWMVDVNPVNLYLALIRDPILAGGLPDGGAGAWAQGLLSALVVTAALVGLAAGVVSWLQKKVIFHL